MINLNKSTFVNLTNNLAVIKINNFYFNIINIKEKSTQCLNELKEIKQHYLITAVNGGDIDTNLNFNFYNYNKKKSKNFLSKKIKWTFLKFKYHGKGYKIKKYNTLSKITFRFGKSHWTKIFFNKKVVNIKRTKKNVYCVLTTNIKYIEKFGKLIKLVKGVNKYTKRGVRLARLKVQRRFGKISQASSVYK